MLRTGAGLLEKIGGAKGYEEEGRVEDQVEKGMVGGGG